MVESVDVVKGSKVMTLTRLNLAVSVTQRTCVQSSDAGTRENCEIAIANHKSLGVIHAELNAPSAIAVLACLPTQIV